MNLGTATTARVPGAVVELVGPVDTVVVEDAGVTLVTAGMSQLKAVDTVAVWSLTVDTIRKSA